jgi:FkbM family methyltransferase
MKKILRKIYQIIPFKKQFFLLVKFFWVPPHFVYKRLHFTGDMKVKIDSSAGFHIMHYGMEIENDIFWKGLTGGWEKISMRLWIQLCRNANVILDIGANTGIYALTAKAVNPGAQVYAFEPLEQMFKKLSHNNEINNFDIVCVQKAVSDKNGKAIIYETGADHVAAASLNVETRAYGVLEKETEIATITLDDFIRENRLNKTDLIKIDVETHEPNVLEGFKKLLPVHKPDFIIEVLTDDVGIKLESLFNGLGYQYFNIDDKKGKIRKVARITKSDYFNYLICSEATARYLKLL